MQKLLRAMHKQEEGFTLVELMVVVVIIGILVAIAIPIYQGIQLNAAESAHDANVRTIQGAGSIFFAQDPDAAAEVEDYEVGSEEGDFDNYIDGPYPEVPDLVAAEHDNIDAGSYTVSIETDGTVNVDPGRIEEEGTQ